MVLGRELQAHDLPRIDVDDHAMQHRHHAVARQRVLPRLEHRMTRFRFDEVHLANLAFVLL